MNTKRIIALCLALFFLLQTSVTVLSAESLPEAAPQISAEEDPHQINETTSIKSDFYRFGITRVKYENLDDLLHSKLISMLYLDSTLYLYFAMPKNIDYDVNYIIINDYKYENNIRLLDTDYNYRKYAFSGFQESPDSVYIISEIGFENPQGEKICYTTEWNCKMGIKDGQYFFEQEAVNNIVLVGMLLESIYQFENERGLIRDAWNNLWNNTTVKDGDQRSFYYFAFNCFDRQIDHYFTPDEIMELVVNYTISRYTYTGPQAGYKDANLTKTTESQKQTITPETIHVEAHSERNSNDNPYVYNTIYKLSEAQIKDADKTANYNTLFTAQQAGYDWVVHFGDIEGYRYCESYTSSFFSDACEIDYTKVDDFSTVSMKYKYKGESYSVLTDTLVDMEVLTQREKDHTERFSKQIADTISYTVKSAGAMASNAVRKVANTVLSKIKNFFTPPKTVACGVAAILLVFVGFKIVRHVKKHSGGTKSVDSKHGNK